MPSKHRLWTNWIMTAGLMVLGLAGLFAGLTGALLNPADDRLGVEAAVVPAVVGLAALTLASVMIAPSVRYWLARRHYRMILNAERA